MTVDSIEAIRKHTTVEVPTERAFEVFTSQMAAWCNPDYRLGAEPFAQVVLEPRPGGAWYEADAAGNQCRWGTVLAWDPPSRVLLNWQINAEWSYDPDQVTELELTFTALSADSTLVELEHRKLEGLGAGAADVRAQFDDPSGWQGLLDRFAQQV